CGADPLVRGRPPGRPGPLNDNYLYSQRVLRALPHYLGDALPTPPPTRPRYRTPGLPHLAPSRQSSSPPSIPRRHTALRTGLRRHGPPPGRGVHRPVLPTPARFG